jgi:aminodeoxyfutalosine synthase
MFNGKRVFKTLEEKVLTGERLSLEDGVAVYNRLELLEAGYLANIVRERMNGNRAHYIRNLHINHTNVCVNGCRFCAFGKPPGERGGYQMDLEEVFRRVEAMGDDFISEVHVVGGCNPDLPYDYFLDMFRGIKEIRPDVLIQGLTAVEIAYIAELSGKSIEDTLLGMKEAGLDSIPGGGAEVFSPRIRSALCPRKLSSEAWLETHKTAHRLGIKTNATMLYGHIESVEERVRHFMLLREAQDETGGFLAFIPLAFHPANTELSHLPGTTGVDDLRTLAAARLMLDNFPHIKAFWIMVGPKISQVSLSFGVDDIDGTVVEEKITHAAGATTAQALTREELLDMIRDSGRDPVERDTLYNVVEK